MIRVTADANIYISGLQFGGVPLAFLNRARHSAFHLAVSRSIFDEVRRILRDKFLWDGDELADGFARLSRFTTLYQPTQFLNVVPSDPDDNHVLECAVASQSQFLVTGDGDLLRLNTYESIRHGGAIPGGASNALSRPVVIHARPPSAYQ